MTYTPLTWANGAMPALNGANLNHIEAGIVAAQPAGAYVTTVSAGANLSTARPDGAAIVYWRFTAGVDVGTDGANIVNRASGDLYYVAAV